MNILLVDDHAVVRQGYAALLSMMLPNASVFEAEDARSVFAILAEHQIDIVILDINLEGSGGLALAPRIRARCEKLKIIFFSMFEEVSIVYRAMQTGASGYISKRCKPEVMIEAIKSVSVGKTYIEHELAMHLAAYSYNESKDILDELTQRELDVFIAVAKGQTRTRIAETLCISEKTVSNLITQVKNKLQANTSAELVRLAIDRGYINVAS